MSVIVIDIKEAVSQERGNEISRAIQASASKVVGEKLEAWLAFQSIAGARINFPLSEGLPDDRHILSEVLKAVPEAQRYRVLKSFTEGPYPRLTKKVATLRITKRSFTSDVTYRVPGEPANPPSPTTLPIKLRFLACNAAAKEAATLEELYLRFPWFGFADADLVSHTEKHVLGRFQERFPMLAEADRLLDDCLISVIRELAHKPRQLAYDHRTFWRAIGDCAFGSLQRHCQTYLAVIRRDELRATDVEAEIREVTSMAGVAATLNFKPHWIDRSEYDDDAL